MEEAKLARKKFKRSKTVRIGWIGEIWAKYFSAKITI